MLVKPITKVKKQCGYLEFFVQIVANRCSVNWAVVEFITALHMSLSGLENTIMSSLTKFAINEINNLSENTQKPQKCN